MPLQENGLDRAGQAVEVLGASRGTAGCGVFRAEGLGTAVSSILILCWRSETDSGSQ